MNENKIFNIIKTGNIVIPLYLFKEIKKLKLTTDEFIFLIYLYNKGNKIIFNPKNIEDDLGIDSKEIMRYISSLTDKDFISVEVVENEKHIMEEYLSLDNFYKKVSLLLMDTDNQNSSSNIFEQIEKEFGRTLAPTEYELIKAWLASNTSEELILLAIKEAVRGGVNNLRYVDKVLYEWNKKNIKNADDVIKDKNKYREKKDKNVEVFEYDWLDDNE